MAALWSAWLYLGRLHKTLYLDNLPGVCEPEGPADTAAWETMPLSTDVASTLPTPMSWALDSTRRCNPGPRWTPAGAPGVLMQGADPAAGYGRPEPGRTQDAGSHWAAAQR